MGGVEMEFSLIVPHLLHSGQFLFSGVNKPFAFCCALFLSFAHPRRFVRKNLAQRAAVIYCCLNKWQSWGAL